MKLKNNKTKVKVYLCANFINMGPTPKTDSAFQTIYLSPSSKHGSKLYFYVGNAPLCIRTYLQTVDDIRSTLEKLLSHKIESKISWLNGLMKFEIKKSDLNPGAFVLEINNAFSLNGILRSIIYDNMNSGNSSMFVGTPIFMVPKPVTVGTSVKSAGSFVDLVDQLITSSKALGIDVNELATEAGGEVGGKIANAAMAANGFVQTMSRKKVQRSMRMLPISVRDEQLPSETQMNGTTAYIYDKETFGSISCKALFMYKNKLEEAASNPFSLLSLMNPSNLGEIISDKHVTGMFFKELIASVAADDIEKLNKLVI